MAEEKKDVARSPEEWDAWVEEMVREQGGGDVDLNGDSLGDGGCAAVGRYVQREDCRVEKLFLIGNSIGDEGAKALGEGIKVNGSIEMLYLRRNSIGDEGAKALGEGIKVNGSIKVLWLSRNSIGDEGAKALGEGIKVNGSIKYLHLSGNSIGDEGAKALGEGIKVNGSIKDLHLGGNPIGAEGANALVNSFASNPGSALETLGGVDLAKVLGDSIPEEVAAPEKNTDKWGLSNTAVLAHIRATMDRPVRALTQSLSALNGGARSVGAAPASAAILPARPTCSAVALALFRDAAGEDGARGPVFTWLKSRAGASVPPAAVVGEAAAAHRKWLELQEGVRAGGGATAVAERNEAAARLDAALSSFLDAMSSGGSSSHGTARMCLAVREAGEAVRAAEDALEAVECDGDDSDEEEEEKSADVRELGETGCELLREWAAASAARLSKAVDARTAAAHGAGDALRAVARLFDEQLPPSFTEMAGLMAAVDTASAAAAAELSARASEADEAERSFPAARVKGVMRGVRNSLAADLDRARRARDMHGEMARVRKLLRESGPAQLEELARAEHEAFAAEEKPLKRQARQARHALEELEEDGAAPAEVAEARKAAHKLRRQLRRLRTDRDRRALELALVARETAPEVLLASREEAWCEPLRRMSDSGGLSASGVTLESFEDLRLLQQGGGEAAAAVGRHRVRVGELDGVRYALKEYAREDAATVQRECARLQHLRHPCVVELRGLVRQGQTHLHLQMPFYEGGTLASLVASGAAASDPARLRLLARQLLLGLDHVHRAGVLHCDIKPANVFLEEAGGTRLRIGDFDVSLDGEARSAHATVLAATTVAAGGLTVAYCAPELLPPVSGRATSKSDVYSAGLALFDLRFPAGSEGAKLRPRPRAKSLCDQAALQRAGARPELAQLLAAMLSRDPAWRPSAAAALAHPYFMRGDAKAAEAARAEEARLGAERACAVCLEEGVREAHGAACPRGDPAHFVCDACLSRKVVSDSDRASVQNRLAEREGRVYCVGYTQAGSACHRSEGPAPYDDAELAAHAGPEAFGAYLGAREEVVRAQLAREADARLEEELARLLAMDEQARRVVASARHVRERTLTLRCPNPNGCGQAFVDFEGCFALTCGRCQGAFCAWCLEWCGRDAHPHVRACGAKPAGADPYYGTREQFERSNRARRCAQLAHYLATLDDETRAGVLQALRQDLRDLGLR